MQENIDIIATVLLAVVEYTCIYIFRKCNKDRLQLLLLLLLTLVLLREAV